MSILRILNRIFRGAIFLPQSLYLNFRALPISQAIKLPIIVMGNTKIRGVHKGNIIINGDIMTGMIKIGPQKTSKRGIHATNKTQLIINDGGLIIFNGDASIGKATSICAKGGKIIFGTNFSCNVNCFIYSQNCISFGNDVLLGWNINIRDNDGHPMYDECGVLVNPDKEIYIGDHVWIASYVDILKGVSLSYGTIVGSRSLVSKSSDISKAVIAGVPARIIKENIEWRHM